MATITDIFEKYEDDLYKNEIKGTILGTIPEVKHDSTLMLMLYEATATSARFKYKAGEKFEILHITDLSKCLTLDFCAYPDINHLFWLYSIKGNKCIIRYLPCGKGKSMEEHIDLGFGDKFISSQKSSNVNTISNNLKKSFVFESDFGDFFLIEKYPGSDQNITVHGLKAAIDIEIIKNKYILTRQKSKSLGNLDNFASFNLYLYQSVSFVDESKAKETLNKLDLKSQNGDTLISLWQKYSELELQLAEELANEIGDMHYSEIRYLSEHEKSLKLNLSEIQKESFKVHRTELKSLSLQMADSGSGDVYKIKTVTIKYGSWHLVVIDEDDTLPSNGVLQISVVGDKAVNRRREIARKRLEDKPTPLLIQLRLSIEGMAEEMTDYRWGKEKALTERTRKFIKDRFGISNLTPNQERAVEIAINTPDICVIQGPPGTGKSTVIAVICDRLIEIAEKKAHRNKNEISKKQILLSAFQNDTVEHIASKVETLGLPTLKVGKESTFVSAEDVLINRMKSHIDDELDKLAPNIKSPRYSKQLRNLMAIYQKEQDFYALRLRIDEILNNVGISDILYNDWKDICQSFSHQNPKKDRQIALLSNLPIESDVYNESGFRDCLKLKRSGLPFNEEELNLLENAPDENPSESFLSALTLLRDKYLDLISEDSAYETSILKHDVLVWLEEVIIYVKEKEEILYSDPEIFLSAVLENLREDLDGNTAYIRDAIRLYSESLAATNQKAGGREMDSRFENVILEEAARSNPLDLLIPMTRAVDRIILVGDQRQLPQLIENKIVDLALSDTTESAEREYKKKSYEESLFGILYKNLEKAPLKRYIQLNEQFRMHPVISDFISNTYYEGNLTTPNEHQAEIRQHGLTVNGLKNKVMVFCDVKASTGAETKGKGKSRRAEAKRVVSLVEEIMADPASENLSIGVITFYSMQVEEIFEQAVKAGLANILSSGDYEISSQFKFLPDGREKLRIGTVDSFQGKEFDVVILSTVRSNDIACEEALRLKKFGFLTLENRLNVAFSRAQRLLIVCGDGNMFGSEYAKKHVTGLYEFYANQSTKEKYGARII